MEKKIVFTPVEPNKNLLWLHYKNGLLVLQRFGSNGWEDITNSDQITEAEVMELIKDKANLVGGKVPAEELPSYVDDVIDFDALQNPSTQISIIVGDNSYKNQIKFINGSSTSSNGIGSVDKYPNMFINFGENTSEDDWTIFEPEKGKIYINATNNHSYRWTGSQLIDLDQSYTSDINYLKRNTVRTDSQDLSVVQQKQAFENLGMKVYVTDSSFIGSAITAEVIEQVDASKVILFTDTGELFLFGLRDSVRISFYRFDSPSSLIELRVNIADNRVYRFSLSYNDSKALHFTVQSPALNSAQQAQAWSNLGLDLVVLKFPKGITSITLTDEEDAKLQSGAAVLVTTDSTDTTSNIYNANNHIFTTIDSKNTSQPLYYSLALFSGLLYCSYDKVSKKFTYQGIIRLMDTGAVRFDRTTPLTSAQQDVALSNIGLNFVHVDYSLLGTTLTDEMFAVLDNAKGIILVDLPSNYYNPFVFIKGNNTSTGCIFVGFATGTTYCQIKLDKSTKILSNINADLTYAGTVRYIEKQSLTDTQKQQARSNIGVQSADELLEDADFIAQLKTKLETV